jgi:hypothetical protein
MVDNEGTPAAPRRPKKYTEKLDWQDLIELATSKWEPKRDTRQNLLAVVNEIRAEFAVEPSLGGHDELRDVLLRGAPIDEVRRRTGVQYAPQILQTIFAEDPAAALVWLCGDMIACDAKLGAVRFSRGGRKATAEQ